MSRTKQSVQRELKQQSANLNVIEEKIAKYTELEAPVHLITQRNEIREQIVELKEMLHIGNLQDEGTPEDAAASLGKLNNVPELPPHFLPRPDDLASIKAALLTREQPVAITGAARKVGLQGMGGIGKSVLAAVLARDEEVRRAFPDGLFWLTLGQEPALTTRQAQLAESLGDPIRIFGDAQQGRARLSELLAERTCLLILDDVWQVAHAEAFNALGPAGQLLLTSRDAGIIRALGVTEHRLGVLNKIQALELLAQWAGQALETLPPEAQAVAKACGYLPLALAMLGAQVRGKPDRWANVLHKLRQADLGKIRQQFPYYPYPDLLRALQVSVEALKPEVQTRYLDLAVFPEDTPIPEAALQTFWAADGLDEYETQDVIDALVDRSLARRDEQGRLSLHDLQYDYVRKQADDLTALHQRLVAAYRQKCPQAWARGPDDGYFFEQLAYHLAEAGQREELYALISKEWMEVQFKRTSSHRAFADDVERVIAVAGAEEPLNLVQVIRGCLIYATLGELVTHVPPEILGVLAYLGQVERALGYASLIQDAQKRSRSYRLISAALLEQDDREAAEQAMMQALAAAEAVQDEGAKAWALSEVAQALAQAGEFDRALAEAVKDEWSKAQALSGVVQALAQTGEFDRALAAAEAVQDEGNKASALREVVQALAQAGEKSRAAEVTNRVLAAAEAVQDEWSKAWALSEVAQALAQTGEKGRAAEVANRALAAVEAVQDEGNKAWALSEVAQALAQAGEFDRALAAAEAVKDEWSKAQALSGVAQALVQAGEFDRALAAAEAVQDEWNKAWALREVAQALVQVGEFDRALAAAEAVQDERAKAWALSEVAQALVQVGEFDQALTAAEAVQDERAKAWALREVAQALAQAGEKGRAAEVANWALAVVEVINDEKEKVQALSEVAQALAQAGEKGRAAEVANRVLAIVEGVKDEGVKALALSGVAQALVQIGGSAQARQIWRDTFTMARLVGRKHIFETLQHSTPALAALDQGETLWQVYEAVMEVEGWWGSGRLKDEG